MYSRSTFHECHIRLTQTVLLRLGDQPHLHAARDRRDHVVGVLPVGDAVHDRVDLPLLRLVGVHRAGAEVLRRREVQRRILREDCRSAAPAAA